MKVKNLEKNNSVDIKIINEHYKDHIVPNGWIECSITDFCYLNMGQSPKSNTYNYNGEGLPFYQGKAEFGALYPLPVKYCSKPLKTGRPGDILLSVRAPVGPTNLLDHKACIGRGLAAVRPLNKIPSKFVLYLFRNLEKSLSSKGTGTTFKAITKDSIESLRINLPPLAEQHCIVEKIEELFSEINKGIEYLQTAKEQLKVYRHAVLKAAFEGGLTKTAKKTEWETSTLDDFAKEIRIGPFGTLLHASDYINNGVPVINPKCIKNQKIKPYFKVSISRDKAKLLETYRLKENDIVLGRRGEMGRTAYITKKENGWMCGTGSMIIRLKNGNSSKLYSLYLSSRKVKSFLLNNSTGTTMNNLNEKIARRIPVPLIPVEEQQRVLDEIESRFSVCDHMEETIEKGLAQAESLKQSILKKAFEGRLVSQNPDDEPAAVLLARVREEKRKREVDSVIKAKDTKKGKKKHE